MTLREQMDRKTAGLPPPCVETEKEPLTLSVHLADGETWIFPWSRFSHACVRGEELKVVFSEQEVVVRGQNLVCVLKHVSTFSVEILRTMAAQYRSLVPVTEPFIVEIEVRMESQQR